MLLAKLFYVAFAKLFYVTFKGYYKVLAFLTSIFPACKNLWRVASSGIVSEMDGNNLIISGEGLSCVCIQKVSVTINSFWNVT